MQSIVHYLDAILAFLSGAATRLRRHLDRSWRSAIALATGLRMHLGRSTRTAAGVAAHLRAHPGRSWRAAGSAAARLRARLGRPWHAASDRRRPARSVETAAPVATLDPGRQWEIVVDIAAREVARAPAIAALQARAALKIDAAEHALGRILADCAKVLPAPAAPTARPAPEPASQPEPQTSRPLAA